MIDKDELKGKLTNDQIFKLLTELGGEPRTTFNCIISKTICHGGESHKLYYYDNTKLFKCYTDCGDSFFDIFDLIIKIKKHTMDDDWTLLQAMQYVASFFRIPIDYLETKKHSYLLEDWKIFQVYNHNKYHFLNKQHNIDYCICNQDILQHLPFVPISTWQKEGITIDIMKRNNIKYYPTQEVILIPHYDINNNLIGIRQRTLFKEEEKNGKYKPAIIEGQMYNHALGGNLYNLNNSKNNIKFFKKAIIFESEKSCMQYASWMGEDYDISVACCGSSLIAQQMQLLHSLGVEEVIIALDKQFQAIGDCEWKKLINNFYNIHKKYGQYTIISYLFDKQNLLNYKDSPSDHGKEIFLQLFNNRIFI